MIKLKSNKGITLIELSIYIIVLSLVIGVLASIRNFFFKNMDIVKETSRYASAFDKFNSYFVKDVKNNNNAKIDSDASTGNLIITFEDGTNYIYNDSDDGIYRGKIKIATNVSAFTASKKTIVINNVEKEIISINIAIGTSNNTMFNKSIDYTLKYW